MMKYMCQGCVGLLVAENLTTVSKTKRDLVFLLNKRPRAGCC